MKQAFGESTLQAVREGHPEALALAAACLAAKWMGADRPHQMPMASDAAAQGCSPVGGLIAAAADLTALLAQCPQGRQALRNLGFQDLLEKVEAERG